jgi:TetR/AcrR family transcriptional regulator, transcriptional repressor for nem operon
MPALSADVSRAQLLVKDTYERKMCALVTRIASLLDGEEPDRERRAWSVVAIMVGAILIARGMPERSELRSALLDSALGTALALIDVGDDAEPVRGSV